MADARERARSFLTQPPDKKPLRIPVGAPGVQTLGAGPAAAQALPFSNFIPSHLEQAIVVAAELMEIANANPGEAGLKLVLQRVQEESERTSVDLAKYALMVFITHHPEGQRLTIPPLEEREPDSVKPSRPPGEQPQVVLLGALGNEAKLDWYREDIAANDHHARWHQVYPARGVPNPANPSVRRTKNRQGELFLYMHEQMLARYDTERRGVGLNPAVPLDDYTKAIPEGYNPNLPPFWNRPAYGKMTASKFTFVRVPDLQGWGTAIANDIRTGGAAFQKPPRTVPDVIGASVEESIDSANANRYGSLHNSGHMVIALIPDPAIPDNQPGGVMGSVSTAIRDPVFYRWHRHVDDLFAEGWQAKQTAQDFSDRPNVTIRDVLAGTAAHGVSPDIILCAANKVGADPQLFGQQQFGDAKFDSDPAASGVTTDVLETSMRRRTLANSIQVEELDHQDFFSFIRVRNDAAAEQTVTLRIFLAANEFIEDRRRWIELDRFQQKLSANEKAVIVRSSKLSAVVRKPARRPRDPQPQPEPGQDPNYCDCGWPYHLLLPRGTKTGMKFRLLVMFTDWQKDKVGADTKCGSMSFCGKRDADYPDIRPMGYPFDRKWPAKIADTIIKPENKNMAARDITIRWT